MHEKPKKSMQAMIRARRQTQFIGRMSQIEDFRVNLARSFDDPNKQFIFSISGPSGIGKTSLLTQLERQATELGYLVASSARPVALLGMISSLTAQLGSLDIELKDFKKRLDDYEQTSNELSRDRDAPPGAGKFITSTAVKVAIGAAKQIPVAGAFGEAVDADQLANQVEHVREYLAKKLAKKADVDLIVDPVGELSKVLVECLNHEYEKKNIRLAIFIDQFEERLSHVEDWLLSLVEGDYGDIEGEIVFIIAGQRTLNPNRWSPYYGVHRKWELPLLSESEVRVFLAQRGIADDRRVEWIIDKSGGLPVYMAALADDPAADVDFDDRTGSVVERFLQGRGSADARSILRFAVPRFLDDELFMDILGNAGIGQRRRASEHVRSLSFVREIDGKSTYHPAVRQPMVRLQRTRSTSDFEASHRRLLRHFNRRCFALAPHIGAGRRSSRWRTLYNEYAYHTMCANPMSAASFAFREITHFLDLEPSALHASGQVLLDAASDADIVDLEKVGRLLQDGAEYNDKRYELLQTLRQWLPQDDRHQVYVLIDLARLCASKRDYLRAASYVADALAISKDEDVELRTNVANYLMLGDRIAEAVTELDAAILVDPSFSWIYMVRSECFRRLGDEDGRKVDLEKALELSPHNFSYILSRAHFKENSGDFEGALEDYDSVLESGNDEGHYALTNRAQLRRFTGRYSEALHDYRALEQMEDVDPVTPVRIGELYRLLGSPERSIEILVELDSEEVLSAFQWAKYSIALAQYSMGQRADAMDNFNRLLSPQERYVRKQGATTDRLNWVIYLTAAGKLDQAKHQLQKLSLRGIGRDHKMMARVPFDELGVAIPDRRPHLSLLKRTLAEARQSDETRVESNQTTREDERHLTH